MEPSLCVATLAAALAHRQGALHVVLGPPDAWRDALPHQERGESPDGPRGGRLRPPPSRAADPAQQGPLTRLQERLQDVSGVGYRVWAAWAAACVSEALIQGLAADETLTLPVALKSWEHVVVGQAVWSCICTLQTTHCTCSSITTPTRTG